MKGYLFLSLSRVLTLYAKPSLKEFIDIVIRLRPFSIRGHLNASQLLPRRETERERHSQPMRSSRGGTRASLAGSSRALQLTYIYHMHTSSQIRAANLSLLETFVGCTCGCEWRDDVFPGIYNNGISVWISGRSV